MRRPAGGAPRPPRTHRYRNPARREHPAPDRVTVPAQPPAAARTRKQAVTQKRLDAGHAVAYREQWCLRAPSRPSPDFGKKVTGRAVPYPTRSRCRRTAPRRNQNHHENHAQQQRRNHANDAHPEWRLTAVRGGGDLGGVAGGGAGAAVEPGRCGAGGAVYDGAGVAAPVRPAGGRVHAWLCGLLPRLVDDPVWPPATRGAAGDALAVLGALHQQMPGRWPLVAALSPAQLAARLSRCGLLARWPPGAVNTSSPVT